jgi:aldoxime dehydratase
MGAQGQLRLYHEVSVVSAEEQYFEYLNCHENTGLLGTG